MKMKKGDMILVIIFLVGVLGWLLYGVFREDTANKVAVIKIDTEIYSTIPLSGNNERQEIPLSLPGDEHAHSLIVTEKENIWVEDSSCPDKICVKTGKISIPGQSIVCLPNKIVIYIEGAEKTKVDDITY